MDNNPHGHSTINNKNNQEQKLCYIYRHIRLDKNEVFYIGKGTNIDGKYERSKNTHRSNPHWHNVINKTEYRIEIMIEGLSEEEANRKEVEFILLYGRRDLGTGTLVNMTAGGEGSVGYKHTEEARKKMSDGNRGKKRTDETRKKISDAYKGNTNSLGYKHTDETRKKMSDAKPKKRVGQYKDDVLIKEYPSVNATKLDGFDFSTVSKCCIGKSKSHKGYQWTFIL